MPALHVIIRPVDSGRTVETSMVNGSISEGILQVSDAQSKAFNAFLTDVRGGEDTSVVEGVLALEDTTGVADYLAIEDKTAADAYLALGDKTGADAYVALVDKDGADAYIALEDKTGADAYLALVDPSGADAYIALTDADVLAVVDAAVGLDNMSAAQKAGLIAYIAAIIAEVDTSSVETAITGLT